jgi:two-component system cell cycle response regulator DivK
MYAWCLRAAGWHAETVADGEHALIMASAFEPDVIVMDLHLPIVDGLEATRRLKASELTRGITVVGCSGYDLQAEAMQAGCAGFVAKPCSPEDLRALLEDLLTRPKASSLQ